jgi:hypothetical protein
MSVDTLGCGRYEVYFNTRGGDNFVCRARNLTSLTWGRRLNEVSEASITIALNGQDEQCCNCVNTVNPWSHEMAVYRDGVEVWCGPVINATIDLEGLTASYTAKDLSTWFDHRWVEIRGTDIEFEEVDVTAVYDWLVQHAYYKDPWNMEWYLANTGVPISRVYVAAEESDRWAGHFQNVGNELRDLSQYGIDFTVVRRVLVSGELESSTNVTATLIDKHWAKLPTIDVVGGSMATEVGVAGGNSGYSGWYDEQTWIERDTGSSFGLLQTFFPAPELDEEDTTTLPNAIAQKAYNLREIKKEPFTYVKGGSLASNAPVTFDNLIPGRVFNLALTQTCRQIQSLYRLYQVDIQLQGEEESVAVQLTPLGAEALRT